MSDEAPTKWDLLCHEREESRTTVIFWAVGWHSSKHSFLFWFPPPFWKGICPWLCSTHQRFSHLLSALAVALQEPCWANSILWPPKYAQNIPPTPWISLETEKLRQPNSHFCSTFLLWLLKCKPSETIFKAIKAINSEILMS